MSEAKFKTMRHIETVRNFLGHIILKLIERQVEHDQSKLESPEVEIFEEYTPKLRNCTYGSDEYKEYLKEMGVALKHHYSVNRHHPEFFKNGMSEMNLIDLIEMLCDWKAATLRHKDGDIKKSLDINQERFGYSDELKEILLRTSFLLDSINIIHKAEES